MVQGAGRHRGPRVNEWCCDGLWKLFMHALIDNGYILSASRTCAHTMRPAKSMEQWYFLGNIRNCHMCILSLFFHFVLELLSLASPIAFKNGAFYGR